MCVGLSISKYDCNTITFDPACDYILGVKIRFVYEGHPINLKGTVTENEKPVLAQCKNLASSNWKFYKR